MKIDWFWHDEQGWWFGDPDSWSMGPYETYEQVMYRYQAAIEFDDKIVDETIKAPKIIAGDRT